MKLALLVGLMGLTLMGQAALAADCDRAGDQTQINACADGAYKQIDNEMGDAYSKLKKRYLIMPAVHAALVKAQRGWLMFRDAECNLEKAGEDGNTAQPMVFSMCLSRLTRARIEQIQIRLNCQAGDLTCIAAGDAAD